MEEVTIKAFDLAKGGVMAYYPEPNVLTGTEVDPISKHRVSRRRRFGLKTSRHRPETVPASVPWLARSTPHDSLCAGRC